MKKKTKKAFGAIFGMALLIFTLCLTQNSPETNPLKNPFGQDKIGRPIILATTPMIADLIKIIGNDSFCYKTLIPFHVDPHSYELCKGDAEKIAQAQLCFYNGLGLEHGAGVLHQLQEHAHAISLGNYLLENAADELYYLEGEIDPHVWLDLKLWSYNVACVVNHLSELLPDQRPHFEQRADQLIAQLLEADTLLKQTFAKVPEKYRYIVTNHQGFNYFVRAYIAPPEERASPLWQKRCAAPQGFAPEAEVSTQDIQNVVKFIIAHNIPILFREDGDGCRCLLKIIEVCKELGVVVKLSAVELYGDTLWKGGGVIAMAKKNSETILEAWKSAFALKDPVEWGAVGISFCPAESES